LIGHHTIEGGSLPILWGIGVVPDVRTARTSCPTSSRRGSSRAASTSATAESIPTHRCSRSPAAVLRRDQRLTGTPFRAGAHSCVPGRAGEAGRRLDGRSAAISRPVASPHGRAR
jgi:hypothetical protein